MDFTSEFVANGSVDASMTLQSAQALEFGADDARSEMHLIIAVHADARARHCL